MSPPALASHRPCEEVARIIGLWGSVHGLRPEILKVLGTSVKRWNLLGGGVEVAIRLS